MRLHIVDYRAEKDAPSRWQLFNRGFWIRDIPRPLLLCRTLGHKPVVDGTGTPGEYRGTVARWVVCDRCGVRPHPQGSLDPAMWNVGDRYTGEWDENPAPGWVPKTLDDVRPNSDRKQVSLPGTWPKNPTWTFNGQAILGSNIPGVSIEAKIGNSASEEPLAAHIRLHPFGALYLGTNSLGRGIQRRLNPTGYESRVIGVDIALGALSWKLWAKRDSWSRSDPRWQQGSIRLNPLTRLLGQKRYWYTDHGDPVTVTVRLPHGDDHTVKLQLQRCEFGRPKLRRRFHSWTTDWECKGGIPAKPDGHGGVWGSAVEVSAAAVREGTWPQEASAGIARQITQDRTGYGFRADTEVA